MADIDEVTAGRYSPGTLGKPVRSFICSRMQKHDRHQIKRGWRKLYRTGIVNTEGGADVAMTGKRKRFLDTFFRIIDAGDRPALLGKIKRIPAFTAAQVQRPARLEFSNHFLEQTIGLRRPDEFPRRVPFVPFLFIRHEREINGRIALMQNISFSDVTALDAPPPDQRLSYGPDPLNFGELWLPEPGRRRGLIMLIHGGCWQSAYGVGHVRPMAHTLREYGFAVWAIEYRRLGDEGGGWPGTFEDVALATDYAQRKLKVDADTVYYIGHSAGAHLALWTAARHRLPADSSFYSETDRPDTTISLAGIVDLEKYARGSSSCEQSAAELIGGPPPAFPERYAEANPRAIGIEENTVFFVGGKDRIVPANQLDGVQRKTQADRNAGHFDFIHPQTTVFHYLTQLLATTAR